MKKIFFPLLLLAITQCQAQVKLAEKDRMNLIALGELHYKTQNAPRENFNKAIDSLRTPAFNHIIDVILEVEKGDTNILMPKFLTRPSNDELVYWEVISEIESNQRTEKKEKKDDQIADEILSKKMDERMLLDKFYYSITRTVAMLFNTVDLSSHNFDMENLGFNNETEKAIFYFNVLESCTQRFKVLNVMKNNQRVLEFAARLPKFNGKAYYYYQSFDYPDFDKIEYLKKQTYNQWHIGELYNTLIIHMNAIAEFKDKDAVNEIYQNSILHEPKYFKFSSIKKDLEKHFKESK